MAGKERAVMKKTGLCVTCDNNVDCVLTRESGVLECEEFSIPAAAANKAALKNRKVVAVAVTSEEELQD